MSVSETPARNDQQDAEKYSVVDPAQNSEELNQISPLDRSALAAQVSEKHEALLEARRTGQGTLGAGIGWGLARLSLATPMRVWNLYSLRHGPLMAAGSAYTMFFSIAALLVAGFSILGMIAAGNTELQDAAVKAVASAAPNIIDTGNGGLVTQEKLFGSSKGYGISLIISTATMLMTALGWISGLRESMRGVYGLPPLAGNPLLVKLRDIGTLILLGIALLVTSAAGSAIVTMSSTIMSWLKLESGFSRFLIWVIGIVVMVVLDMLVALILFKVASGISMNGKARLVAAFIAGLGATVLRLFSSQIIASAGKNPILAPFVVILGLFVWFYFLSQVYLIATATGCVISQDTSERDAEKARLWRQTQEENKEKASQPMRRAGSLFSKILRGQKEA